MPKLLLQGSRLAPILFLIMINGIITLMLAIVLIFADDTTINTCGDNTSETVEVLNADLVKISDGTVMPTSTTSTTSSSREKGRYASPSPSSTTLTEAGGRHVVGFFSRHHAHKHAHHFGNPYIFLGGS